MKQVIRFEPVQTAKVVSVLYLILFAVFCVPFAIFAMYFNPTGQFGAISGGFLLFAPVLYGIVTFVMVCLGCLLYNVVAKFTGGIAFTVQDKSAEPTSPFPTTTPGGLPLRP